MSNMSTVSRILLTLWGVMLAFLFGPRVAQAQERMVATDVQSCHEFAQPVITVTLAGLTEVPQILALSWNGGTQQQGEDYLNRQVPFPAPVLARGLPTRLDRRDIGPRNWLRPATDNAFRCEFQTNSNNCPNTQTHTSEGSFITLVDLFKANPINRFQATVTVTEEFIRPATEVVPPVQFPQSQTLRRSTIGVPEGSVRWIYTATANLTPNCEGRPTVPLFVNGIPTPAGRTYLAGACTPVNAASLETLYGWHPVQRYVGSTLSVQFKVRALPGRLQIPRSTAYQGVAEQACLTMAQVPVAVSALSCTDPAQLTRWNEALIPAMLPGMAADDIRQAVRAVSTRVNAALEGPKCADAQLIQAANTRAQRATTIAGNNDRLANRWKALAIKRGDVNKVGFVVVAILAVIIAVLLHRQSKQDDREVSHQQEDRVRSENDIRVDAKADVIYHTIMSARDILRQDPTTISFAEDADKLEPEAETSIMARMSAVHLVVQGLLLALQKFMTQNAGPRGSSLPTTTPPGGVSTLMGEGAHAFFRRFVKEVYSDVRAGRDQEVRTLRDRLMALKADTAVKDWEATAAAVAQHVLSGLRRSEILELARMDLILLFGGMTRTVPTGRRDARAQLTDIQAKLSVIAEYLEDWATLGQSRLGVLVERRFNQKTATHLAVEEGDHSGVKTRGLPPQGGTAPA